MERLSPCRQDCGKRVIDSNRKNDEGRPQGAFGISLYLCGVELKLYVMIVERVNDEVVIRLPKFMDFEAVQRMIDLLSLKEATSRSEATQEDIDKLAEEADRGWWAKNRDKYMK
jgi:hypothetical protein